MSRTLLTKMQALTILAGWNARELPTIGARTYPIPAVLQDSGHAFARLERKGKLYELTFTDTEQ